MNTYRSLEVYRHALLISAASRSDRFVSLERTQRYPFYREVGGLRGLYGSDGEEENLHPFRESNPSRYSNWATVAPFNMFCLVFRSLQHTHVMFDMMNMTRTQQRIWNLKDRTENRIY